MLSSVNWLSRTDSDCAMLRVRVTFSRTLADLVGVKYLPLSRLACYCYRSSTTNVLNLEKFEQNLEEILKGSLHVCITNSKNFTESTNSRYEKRVSQKTRYAKGVTL